LRPCLPPVLAGSARSNDDEDALEFQA